MNKLRCGVCGAFVSLKRRIYEEDSTGILIYCAKCGAVLSVQLITPPDEVVIVTLEKRWVIIDEKV